MERIGAILGMKGNQVYALPPKATVYDAIAMMDEKRVGAILVVDEGKLVGIISERDYARKVVLKDRSSKLTLIEEIMTRPVVTVTPDHRVNDCMRIMTDQRIRHLPVVEGERIVGVVSIGDLVRWTISSQAETINQLSNYIAGKYPA